MIEKHIGQMMHNPPHPADFGIPKEHWEAAQHYANYWHLDLVKTQQRRQVITDPAVIREASHPCVSGIRPQAARRLADGSKISSSEPLTEYPFLCRAMARLCMALPPMAIK